MKTNKNVIWILDNWIMVSESECAHLLFCLPPGNDVYQHSDPTYCDAEPLHLLTASVHLTKKTIIIIIYFADLLEIYQASLFYSEKKLHCPLDKPRLHCK